MRNLFRHDTLRHRLADRLEDLDLPFLHEDEHRPHPALMVAAGALAGFAVGVLLSKRMGGFEEMVSRFKGRGRGFGGTSLRGGPADGAYDNEDEDFYEDEDVVTGDLSPDEELEERVLEAYYNDPILSERAVDIGAVDAGIIELTGWVNTQEEAEHAVTLARGVPGVETVINRLTIQLEEARRNQNAQEYKEALEDSQPTEQPRAD